MKILLADDDPERRSEIAKLVRRLPFEATVVEAGDRAAAVDLVARETPVVVLLDATLEGASAVELTEQLRAVRPTPIVLLTPDHAQEAVGPALRAGAADYLPKDGLDVARLEHAIRAAIRVADAERAAQAATEALEHHAAQLTLLFEASLRVNATTRIEEAVNVTAEAAATMLEAHAHVDLQRGRARHRAEHGAAPNSPATAHALEIDLAVGAPPSTATLRLTRDHPFERAEHLLAKQLARACATAIEKQLLVETARENAKARQEIVSIVSHDLRTPLQSFSLGLDVLTRHTAGNESAGNVLARLRRGVDAMNRLLTNLLDVTRIRDASLSLHLAKHTPKSLLEELAEQTAPLAHQKGLELKVGAAIDQRFVCDGTRIAQALSNFISNAIKHTETGTIELRALRDGENVRFEVVDTGPGVKPEVRAHLFERLYQAPGGARGGIGLGLYIAKGIAEAHGGHVGVESELGRGSTFFLCIPLIERVPVVAADAIRS